MGIKFLCPQGHKLNVKSYLTGKKAICPVCGARVIVPAESIATEPSPEIGGPHAAGEGESIELPIATAAAELSATEGGGNATASINSAERESAAEPDNVAEPDNAVESKNSAEPIPGAEAVPAAPNSDPIEGAPGAVWYVRPATGGQFGPASGEIMRAWLSEGRVGASSLVWRTPWTEWRSAAAVFPELTGLLASPGIAVAPPQIALLGGKGIATAIGNGLSASLPVGHVVQTIPVGQRVPAPASTSSVPDIPVNGVQRRRRRKDLSMLASAILVLVSIILLVILVLVWRYKNALNASPSVAPDPPAAAPAD